MYVQYSSTEVRALLKEYFERSHNLAHNDQELYVLCIQCFEVRLVVVPLFYNCIILLMKLV